MPIFSQILQALKPELSVNVANDLDDLSALVQRLSREDDLVLAMGAGDVNSLWTRLTS